MVKLNVGDKVRTIIRTEFVDGTSHEVGEILTCEEDTLPYFEYFIFLNKRYELIEEN